MEMTDTGQACEQAEASLLQQIPAYRFNQANEIAAAGTFLASPAASCTTGVSLPLPVDGGLIGRVQRSGHFLLLINLAALLTLAVVTSSV